jgi:hypothetical protein
MLREVGPDVFTVLVQQIMVYWAETLYNLVCNPQILYKHAGLLLLLQVLSARASLCHPLLSFDTSEHLSCNMPSHVKQFMILILKS